MHKRRIVKELIFVLFVALVLYGLSLVNYHLNRAFIEANRDALPFTYQIVLAVMNLEFLGVLILVFFSFLFGIVYDPVLLELLSASLRCKKSKRKA
ncbi:MAG: hypothetical protein JXB14_07675 [Candidatus Altiarchaeota archaeon]|nr:hypothetical protein [Candidatus Altiarchaeota archaeon]